MSTDELYLKALRSLVTCLLISNYLCGKLVSSLQLPFTLDDKLYVTSVVFFVADFNLLSCESDNFKFTLL